MFTLKSIKRALVRDFTYGFEIEGAFRSKLADKVDGDWKEDGSVELLSGNECWNHTLLENDNGNIASEFASRIYPNLKAMLEPLKLFKHPDYFTAPTAGLHVHLKPKAGKRVAEQLFLTLSAFETASSTFNEFKQLTNSYANDSVKCKGDSLSSSRWSSCYALRWSNLFYYNRYSNKKSFISDWSNGEKHRYYILNQGYNTIEFRFFSPYPCHREQALRLMFMELLPKALFKASKQWQALNNHVVKINGLPAKGQLKVKLTI